MSEPNNLYLREQFNVKGIIKQMDSVLISVIVPIFNVSEYLPQCIESIINQTYKNLEIILVDDGSTDDSGAICEEYKVKDARIRVLHKKNEGLVRARKEGLKTAHGEYVAFVDGDDSIDNIMYEEMLKVAVSSQVDVVNTGLKRAGNATMLSPDFNLTSGRYDVVEILTDSVLDLNVENIVSHNLCNKLFKKEIINKCYTLVPDTQSFGEDWLCFCACMCESVSLVSLDKAYYNYTVRENSLSHEYSAKCFLNATNLYKAFIDLFKYYGIYDELKSAVDNVLKYLIIDALRKSDSNIIVQKYSFPSLDTLHNKRIIIYGAGMAGRDYYAELSRYRDIQIVAWVDKKFNNIKYKFCDVESIDIINHIDFDYIIISNIYMDVALGIKDELKKMGVSENKIIWSAPLLV